FQADMGSHSMACRSLPRKLTEREHWITESPESFTTAQIRQIDHEGAADDRAAGHPDQSKRRFRCSARSNQVVDQQHALAALDGVTMELQSAGAILELVVMTEIFCR